MSFTGLDRTTRDREEAELKRFSGAGLLSELLFSRYSVKAGLWSIFLPENTLKDRIRYKQKYQIRFSLTKNNRIPLKTIDTNFQICLSISLEKKPYQSILQEIRHLKAWKLQYSKGRLIKTKNQKLYHPYVQYQHLTYFFLLLLITIMQLSGIVQIPFIDLNFEVTIIY